MFTVLPKEIPLHLRAPRRRVHTFVFLPLYPMKKFLALLALPVVLAACQASVSEQTEPTEETAPAAEEAADQAATEDDGAAMEAEVEAEVQ